MKASQVYSEGEWLVHSVFGIGQIMGIEVKNISGANIDYFRIQTFNSTYWVPVNRVDSEKMRPVATLEEFARAIAILQRPPKAMSADHKVRKTHMERVQNQNMPEEMARLMRDLRARQRDKGVYHLDENNAIRTLKQRLADEWSVISGETIENATSRLDALLDH
ncbi:MAG: CarD family transcriptional regulator [Candidatus Promineifilaceae bacterium]|jgi:RNA polymerase-interacting CarD/CdnL/TRCF family regulator